MAFSIFSPPSLTLYWIDRSIDQSGKVTHPTSSLLAQWDIIVYTSSAINHHFLVHQLGSYTTYLLQLSTDSVSHLSNPKHHFHKHLCTVYMSVAAILCHLPTCIFLMNMYYPVLSLSLPPPLSTHTSTHLTYLLVTHIDKNIFHNQNPAKWLTNHLYKHPTYMPTMESKSG